MSVVKSKISMQNPQNKRAKEKKIGRGFTPRLPIFTWGRGWPKIKRWGFPPKIISSRRNLEKFFFFSPQLNWLNFWAPAGEKKNKHNPPEKKTRLYFFLLVPPPPQHNKIKILVFLFSQRFCCV